MAINLSEFLDVLKDSYSAYYTIVEDSACEYPLAFRADYASRDELYLLTKSVRFWGNEKNEYAYIFAAPSFTPSLADACMEWAIKDMLPRVKPHKEHQCTNVKVVFIAETVDGETAKTVQKKSFTKNYRHGLHGFTNLLAGITDLSTEKTVTNRAGHDLVPYFKKLFAARAKS